MKRALLQMMWAEKAQTKMLSGCFGDLTVAIDSARTTLGATDSV
jgi:hypothetical protein